MPTPSNLSVPLLADDRARQPDAEIENPNDLYNSLLRGSSNGATFESSVPPHHQRSTGGSSTASRHTINPAPDDQYVTKRHDRPGYGEYGGDSSNTNAAGDPAAAAAFRAAAEQEFGAGSQSQTSSSSAANDSARGYSGRGSSMVEEFIIASSKETSSASKDRKKEDADGLDFFWAKPAVAESGPQEGRAQAAQQPAGSSSRHVHLAIRGSEISATTGTTSTTRQSLPSTLFQGHSTIRRWLRSMRDLQTAVFGGGRQSAGSSSPSNGRVGSTTLGGLDVHADPAVPPAIRESIRAVNHRRPSPPPNFEQEVGELDSVACLARILQTSREGVASEEYADLINLQIYKDFDYRFRDYEPAMKHLKKVYRSTTSTESAGVLVGTGRGGARVANGANKSLSGVPANYSVNKSGAYLRTTETGSSVGGDAASGITGGRATTGGTATAGSGSRLSPKEKCRAVFLDVNKVQVLDVFLSEESFTAEFWIRFSAPIPKWDMSQRPRGGAMDHARDRGVLAGSRSSPDGGAGPGFNTFTGGTGTLRTAGVASVRAFGGSRRRERPRRSKGRGGSRTGGLSSVSEGAASPGGYTVSEARTLSPKNTHQQREANMGKASDHVPGLDFLRPESTQPNVEEDSAEEDAITTGPALNLKDVNFHQVQAQGNAPVRGRGGGAGPRGAPRGTSAASGTSTIPPDDRLSAAQRSPGASFFRARSNPRSPATRGLGLGAAAAPAAAPEGPNDHPLGIEPLPHDPYRHSGLFYQESPSSSSPTSLSPAAQQGAGHDARVHTHRFRQPVVDSDSSSSSSDEDKEHETAWHKYDGRFPTSEDLPREDVYPLLASFFGLSLDWNLWQTTDVSILKVGVFNYVEMCPKILVLYQCIVHTRVAGNEHFEVKPTKLKKCWHFGCLGKRGIVWFIGEESQ